MSSLSQLIVSFTNISSRYCACRALLSCLCGTRCHFCLASPVTSPFPQWAVYLPGSCSKRLLCLAEIFPDPKTIPHENSVFKSTYICTPFLDLKIGIVSASSYKILEPRKQPPSLRKRHYTSSPLSTALNSAPPGFLFARVYGYHNYPASEVPPRRSSLQQQCYCEIVLWPCGAV